MDIDASMELIDLETRKPVLGYLTREGSGVVLGVLEDAGPTQYTIPLWLFESARQRPGTELWDRLNSFMSYDDETEDWCVVVFGPAGDRGFRIPGGAVRAVL